MELGHTPASGAQEVRVAASTRPESSEFTSHRTVTSEGDV